MQSPTATGLLNTDTQHNTNLKWRANCGDQTISTIDNQQATPHTTIATIV